MSDKIDIADAFEPESLTLRRRTPAAPPVQPATMGEAFSAGWLNANAGADWGANQTHYETDLLNEMQADLKKRGYRTEYFSPKMAEAEARNRALGIRGGSDYHSRQSAAFWKAVNAEGAKDSAFAAKFGGAWDHESLIKIARDRRTDDADKSGAVWDRSGAMSSAAFFAGSVAGRWWDPTNYIPVGGGATAAGQSIARQILITGAKEAAANALVEVALQPLVARDSATNLGKDRTLGDAAFDIGAAAVFGGVLGSAFKGGELGLRKLLAGDGALTPDQEAAIAVLRREEEIEAGSPYIASPAADAHHRAQLAAAIEARLAAVNGEAAPAAPAMPQPVPTGVVVRVDVAPAGAVPAGAARDILKSRIRRAESAGDDAADNPRSSALGRYQFITSTFRSYYLRRFGRQGLTDGQIDAKRGDAQLQEVLVNDLIADNERALRGQGHAVTAGNLYLAHFAGPKGANRVLGAAPDTPLTALLTPDAIAANPFLQGRTAGWLANWAARKMGEPAALHGGSVPVPRRELFSDDSAWEAAAHAETQLAMERQRIEMEDARNAAEERGEPLIDDDDYDLSVEMQPWEEVAVSRGSLARIDLAEQADDVAIAADGSERPVRYAIVDLADVRASHDDAGAINPDYPAELQPRDRSRGVSQAQVADMAAKLDARLLGRSPLASAGAPILSADGMAVSGNGRVLAIRRAYAQGGQRADAYRDYVQGLSPEAAEMGQPALVRLLPEGMAEDELVGFAKAANARDTAGYSATEQALSDAAVLTGEMLDELKPGGLDLAANRGFIRAFLRSLPQTEYNALVTADGTASAQAYRRIEAALLARAYGQASLVAELVESADANVKSIGGALADVAGPWAQMVDAIERGSIDRGIDITSHVNEAVAIVQKARNQKMLIGDIVNQRDVFSGEAISPQTEGVLRLFFANEAMTKPISRERIGEALRLYAREAMKVQADDGLFGAAVKVTDRELLALVKERQTNGSIFDPEPAEPVGEGAPEVGPDSDGPEGTGVSREDGDGIEGPQQGWLNAETLRRWDDPDGDAAEEQLLSLEHDAAMLLPSPPGRDHIADGFLDQVKPGATIRFNDGTRWTVEARHDDDWTVLRQIDGDGVRDWPAARLRMALIQQDGLIEPPPTKMDLPAPIDNKPIGLSTRDNEVYWAPEYSVFGDKKLDVRTANTDGEMTPEFELMLSQAEIRAKEMRKNSETPIFHGTSGDPVPFGTSGLGMSFWTDDSWHAGKYAGAGGGRRIVGDVGRVVVGKSPAPNKILDTTTRDGLAVIAGIEAETNQINYIINYAKRTINDPQFKSGSSNFSNQLWTFTKRAPLQWAEDFNTEIVQVLRAKGFEAIKFVDENHETIAIFDEFFTYPPPAKMDLPKAVDPAIARKQIEEAQLQADAPLRAPDGQEGQSGTMGTPLFDDADQPLFDLGDGEARTAKDLFDEMDRAQAEIAAVKKCAMPPVRGEGGGA